MKAKLYPFYSHRRDPVVDRVVSFIPKERGSKKNTATRAGVSVTTVSNYENKKTRRPQFMTIVGLARSLGPEAINAVVDTIRRGR